MLEKCFKIAFFFSSEHRTLVKEIGLVGMDIHIASKEKQY